MAMTIGGKTPQSIEIGGKAVQSLAIGGEVVWSAAPSGPEHFYIEALAASDTVTITRTNSTMTSGTTLQYSTDGETWTTVTYNSNTFTHILSAVGDRLYLRSSDGLSSSAQLRYTINFSTDTEMGGDLKDLIDYTASGKVSVPNYTFYATFFYSSINSNVLDISNLSFENLTNCGDNSMSAMFQNCAGITTLPSVLCDTKSVAGNTYAWMFLGCTGITAIPSGFLPDTSIGNNTAIYKEMFRGCTGLTSVPADLLKSTTLNSQCYSGMFQGCTSLITAPDLPATTLVSQCYNNMFKDCSSLNKVTVYATAWNTSYATDFLSGVSGSGDFYNLGGATIPTGANGIPSGWTEHTSL